MKDFIPYEQALELKELGFDEECFGFYTHKGELRRYTNFDGELNDFQTLKNSSITMGDNWCAAPTYSQAFRWFREKFEIHSFIDCKWKNLGWEYELVDLNKMEKISCIGNYGYKTPEEAELACLRKLIEIVKTK
jgi:hypothetical protein